MTGSGYHALCRGGQERRQGGGGGGAENGRSVNWAFMQSMLWYIRSINSTSTTQAAARCRSREHRFRVVESDEFHRMAPTDYDADTALAVMTAYGSQQEL
jgi:hypothetical protein